MEEGGTEPSSRRVSLIFLKIRPSLTISKEGLEKTKRTFGSNQE